MKTYIETTVQTSEMVLQFKLDAIESKLEMRMDASWMQIAGGDQDYEGFFFSKPLLADSRTGYPYGEVSCRIRVGDGSYINSKGWDIAFRMVPSL